MNLQEREEKIRNQAYESCPYSEGDIEDNTINVDPDIAYQEGFCADAKWSDKNPIHYDGKAFLYVNQKSSENAYKRAIEEACKWLDENIDKYVFEGRLGKPYVSVALTDDFKKDLIQTLNNEQQDI